MVNLPLWSIFVIYVGAVLLAYLILLPLVNGDSCKLLAESNIGIFNQVSFRFIAGCWVPWS